MHQVFAFNKDRKFVCRWESMVKLCCLNDDFKEIKMREHAYILCLM